LVLERYSRDAILPEPEFLLEGQELGIFLEAIQGDPQGIAFVGRIEQAAQADFQEVELFQHGMVMFAVLEALDGLPIPGQVPGVAAEGGGAEAILGGQGAVGDPVQQGPVDLLQGFMATNGTRFRHEMEPPICCGTVPFWVNNSKDGQEKPAHPGRLVAVKKVLSFEFSVFREPVMLQENTHNQVGRQGGG
jgi:hypothetical protein